MSLFSRPPYLDALEDSASPDKGWSRLRDLAAPIYRKEHSWGEFVFDQAFAQAYAQAGLDYYPKLVCAIPFTPVCCAKLGSQPAATAEALRQRIDAGEGSSAHLLFLPESERAAISDPQWLRRRDLRFVWRDREFGDFDGFLASLKAKKRKNIRAERRQVLALGLDIDWQPAARLSDEDWQRVYRLYASTYHMRGQAPYLSFSSLQKLGAAFPEQMLFCLARDAEDIQAMAYFFHDHTSLYGRHWGAARDYPGLHFELCYYQGIDYCLKQGLAHFDAGVQGHHRLLRGFVPEWTDSLHYFRDPRFRAAIHDYLERERSALSAQKCAWERQSAFAKV